MFTITKLVFIFIVQRLVLSAKLLENDDCVLRVPNNLEQKSPIFLNASYEYILPSNEFVHLRQGQNIILACPGPKNFVTQSHTNYVDAICKRGNSLEVSNKLVKLDDLQCEKIVKGELQKTNQTCGGHLGKKIIIGYRLDKSDFIKLIDVCYDEVNGNTLFTQHYMYGKQIKYASKSKYRPSFSTAGLGKNIAASVAYKQAFQKATFNNLLKSAKIAETYIHSKSFLARGHLSPDADFLFAPWQYSTYFYINACPQWQSINGGNWLGLENTVRKTAEKHQDTFRIITGTHGILTLRDANNMEKGIYLSSGKKITVPKYVWKAVYSEKKQLAVAFVSVNNPFIETIDHNDLLCKNICKQTGWNNGSWTNPAKGYIYCCDVKELMAKITYFPSLTIRGILTV